MKVILVLAALVGLVRSEPRRGYAYNTPQMSFGSTANQYSGEQTNIAGAGTFGLTSQGLPSTESKDYAFRQQGSSNLAQNYGLPKIGSYNTGQSGLGGGYKNVGSRYQFSNNGGYQTNFGYQPGKYQTQSSSGSSRVQPYLQQTTNNVGVRQHGSSNQYQSFVDTGYSKQVQQPVQVFKHIYVHTAPEEPEVPQFRQPPVLPPPQKHYKIIFIKTPAPPAPVPQYIPLQPQNEEKTIVYVLVKKPEEVGQIVLPKIEQKPPTKPEVFFIKYSGKDNTQGVINNVLSDHNRSQGLAAFSSSNSEISGGGFNELSSSSTQALSGTYGLPVAGSSSEANQAVTILADQPSSVDDSNAGFAQIGSTVSSVESSQLSDGFQSEANSVTGSAASQNIYKPNEGPGVESHSSVSSHLGAHHDTYGLPNVK